MSRVLVRILKNRNSKEIESSKFFDKIRNLICCEMRSRELQIKKITCTIQTDNTIISDTTKYVKKSSLHRKN